MVTVAVKDTVTVMGAVTRTGTFAGTVTVTVTGTTTVTVAGLVTGMVEVVAKVMVQVQWEVGTRDNRVRAVLFHLLVARTGGLCLGV